MLMLLFCCLSIYGALVFKMQPFIFNVTYFTIYYPIYVGTPGQQVKFIFSDYGTYNTIESHQYNTDLINATFYCPNSTTCSSSTYVTNGLGTVFSDYSGYATTDVIYPTGLANGSTPFSFYIPSSYFVTYIPYADNNFGYITLNPTAL